ncbi:hypothetical protein LCGC14_0551810 [marine sediment metagenome]|uniref:Uncharacterized protein n=1 Tax=marine sediment metagenome TaxID=412755 RepID=A0A0F9RUM8_9ZZZZ
MMRELDTKTLGEFACACATNFTQPSRYSTTHPKVAIYGREWVLQCLVNLHFKDEFEYVVAAIKPKLGPEILVEFEKETAERFTPRFDTVLAEQLALRLAITPEGDHIPGKIGNVLVGSRTVANRITSFEKKGSMRRRLNAYEAGETPPAPEVISITRPANWPVYAGEDEERALEGGGAADPLPNPNTMFVGDQHMQPVKEG